MSSNKPQTELAGAQAKDDAPRESLASRLKPFILVFLLLFLPVALFHAFTDYMYVCRIHLPAGTKVVDQTMIPQRSRLGEYDPPERERNPFRHVRGMLQPETRDIPGQPEKHRRRRLLRMQIAGSGNRGAPERREPQCALAVHSGVTGTPPRLSGRIGKEPLAFCPIPSPVLPIFQAELCRKTKILCRTGTKK